MQYLSLQEYAARAQISERTVLRRITSGDIEAIRQDDPRQPNGKWLIPNPDYSPDTSPDPSPAPAPTLPAYVPGKLPRREKVPEAQAFARFMAAVEARLASATSRTTAWERITEEYNAKVFCPELYRYRGRRTERALRHWHLKWRESGQDMFALVHRSAGRRGRKVLKTEQDFLFKLLLNPHKLPIAVGIQKLKEAAADGGFESPSSERTLRRWMDDWIAANPDIWGCARRGTKWTRENIVKSVMRDFSLIRPGDILVADGHTLAFDVINPRTGKAQRMTLILIYDWGSCYPVGAALATSEDGQHILAAVRNAILQLGMTPKAIYFDNGKAFRAMIFHREAEDHDLELEFAGVFPRLGIEAVFAKPYNARSKVIERFFKTLQDQFEHFQATFRGRNIDDKPATLARNEKWAQKMFSGEPLDYTEAMAIIYYYVRYEYGLRPHSALKGRKPYEVFASREIDPTRAIDPGKLDLLMLTAERKRLDREGIWLNKCRYYHPLFVKYVGQNLIIRWDYADLRWIYVYDSTGEYICTAELREARHPLARIDMENPISYHDVMAEFRANEQAVRTIQRKTEKIIKTSNKSLETALARHRAAREQRLAEIKGEGGNPAFVNPPIITPPRPQETPDPREIAKLAAEAKAAETGEETVIDATPPKPSTFAQKLLKRGIGAK